MEENCSYSHQSYSCGQSRLEGSSYCIFHQPQEKDEESFREGLKTKIENGDYDFRGYVFPGGCGNFMLLSLNSPDFSKAEFLGKAEFAEVTIGGTANFNEVIFHDRADFAGVRFEDDAEFGGAEFRELTIFQGAAFAGYADFTGAIFEGEVNFGGSNFDGDANFINSIFMKDADFRESDFKETVNFNFVTASGLVFFTRPYDFYGAEFIRSRRIKSFNRISDAVSAYRLAKLSHQRNGIYDEAREYNYWEKVARRAHKGMRGLPEMIFAEATCGYGERPYRLVFTALVLLMIFAVIYMNVGHIYTGVKSQPTVTQTGKGKLLLLTDPTDPERTKPDFLTSLYFSATVFTTLGYGDVHPEPDHWVRIIVAIEAFVGAFTIVGFVGTFLRRVIL
jgi:uncharacterized protein YjbI with pentapeptide repeats